MKKLPENIIDVECPDCKNTLRIDITKPAGHCQFCGRLLRVNKETMEVEPGEGKETDVILTQYEKQRRRQKFGSKNN